jgi:hypothetical protein
MPANEKWVTHLLLPIIIVVILVVVVGAFMLATVTKKPSVPNQPFAGKPGGVQMMMSNPLLTHDIYITFSTDGQTWQPGMLVKAGASVPELIQLTREVGQFKVGDLLIYFVDASTLIGHGTEGINIHHSSDLGKTWREVGLITVANKPNQGAVVDPAIVQLADSTLRLYYFGSETTTGDPASAQGPHKVYSATSRDGLSWTIESGARFQNERLTDPEVISYNNQWYMYYSVGPETKLATSTDGLNFTGVNMTGGNVGGVPGAVEINGEIRLYGCSQGISTAISTNGVNFSIDERDIIKRTKKPVVCDPSVIKLIVGRYAMAYKIAEPSQDLPVGPPIQKPDGQPILSPQKGRY